ncbi:ParA/MinD-like ATPase [Thermincola ferriacetica]|uniref:Iron-sulfur cluster carrier protein n=1 Tax=Thermincola ferriacetica TaxID=281456 RepID=A0A0L6W1M6_9FIRM|nr:Mrp/NBP35 family ATP-binding protein [Thermincola ferriacetica]KNZ68974.1 ParA/MinD-like ATPase [Thermincola ferriacetica]
MSSACSTCSQKEGCSGESCPGMPENKHNIRNVIAVMSGKGGVGKSSVTAMLAVALRNEGFKVGIMDADVTGPSIPRLFGLHGRLKNGEKGIQPAKTRSGIEVISLNLLLPNEDEPVIWRGPVISGVVKQFWTDVEWGELDYMLVDLPPGTGDVPLTVMQTLPLNGIIVVTTPQSLVTMIVKKAIHMADRMHIPVIGLVENYTYVHCPDCDKRIELFGHDNTEEATGKMGVPLLGQLPLDPEFAAYSDRGEIENYFEEKTDVNETVANVARLISKKYRDEVQ